MIHIWKFRTNFQHYNSTWTIFTDSNEESSITYLTAMSPVVSLIYKCVQYMHACSVVCHHDYMRYSLAACTYVCYIVVVRMCYNFRGNVILGVRSVAIFFSNILLFHFKGCLFFSTKNHFAYSWNSKCFLCVSYQAKRILLPLYVVYFWCVKYIWIFTRNSNPFKKI